MILSIIYIVILALIIILYDRLLTTNTIYYCSKCKKNRNFRWDSIERTFICPHCGYKYNEWLKPTSTVDF